MAQEWWRAPGYPGVCGVLRAVSPGVGRIRVHPPLPRGLVGFPLPSRRAAERGAAPRRAPDVGGSLGRAHGREGRGVGRTRGWAAGRPAFAPETVFSPFWAFHALEWGRPRNALLRAPKSL